MRKLLNSSTWRRLSFLLFAILLFGRLWAAPTSQEQARQLVKGWLNVEPQPLNAELGQQVLRVETYSDSQGRAVYYVVYLEPSGFVIVPADDLVEPVICFSSEGTYNPSPDNPLGAMVSRDLPSRLSAVRSAKPVPEDMTLKSAETSLRKSMIQARRRWTRLQEAASQDQSDYPVFPEPNVLEDEANGTLGGLPHVPDVRVEPLIESKWSQSTVCGQACFNYYTPPYGPGNINNYVCGCCATATAQLLRYHQHPNAPADLGPYLIHVDGEPEMASLGGGDGFGGPYQWEKMVLVPDCNITLEQRKAIGAICHDAGVAENMWYTAGGSGCVMPDIQEALEGPFDYSNAVLCDNSGQNIPTFDLYRMLNPNLDANYPVLLGIHGVGGGHAIVADGYGYDGQTIYHHLNMGWSGFDDAWYTLPLIQGEYANFNMVDSCVYNVFQTGSGEIISGRVMHVAGFPIINAQVTAQGPGGPFTTTVNDKGIYAFPKVQSNSTYTISVSRPGYYFQNQVVDIQVSRFGGTSGDYDVGNLWGIDFFGADGLVSIIEPNGGEEFARGLSYEITWDYQGNVGPYVKIELYKDDQFDSVIVQKTTNDGFFLWTINPDQEVGSDYRIVITSLRNNYINDDSDEDFSIVSGAPRLDLTNPVGGQSFLRGGTVDIEWDSAGAVGDFIKIQLYRGPEKVELATDNGDIVTETDDDGLYQWQIPDSLEPSTEYRIKIICVADPTTYDITKTHFTIFGSSIVVTSPVGGEVWQRGVSYDITWQHSGTVGNTVRIDLYQGGVFHSILADATENDGLFAWGVDPNLDISNDYTVRVTSVDDPNFFDEIDGDFAIYDIAWAELPSKIFAFDGTQQQNFAYAVALDEDYAAFGAVKDQDMGIDAGAAYIFERQGEVWAHQAKLTASDPNDYDYFGTAVDIHGEFVVAGAPGDDENGNASGAVYVYERDGGVWSQQVKLAASDASSSARFGSSVSIDGDYLIVGAYGEDGNGTDSGAAYIFKFSGGNWVQQQKLTANQAGEGDYFGYSVSISGQYAIVGAWGDGGTGVGRPAAYIFKRTDDTWSQQTRLDPPGGQQDTDFGFSVSITGDNAVVGAYTDVVDQKNTGAAYVFERDKTQWVQRAKLSASDAQADIRFGSVSIKDEYIIVGARWDLESGQKAGAAYIFKYNDRRWLQYAKLISTDVEAYDYFGSAVDISSDFALMGAYGDDDKGFDSGAAYLFTSLHLKTPNGGEQWIASDPCEITWSGSPGAIGTEVKIELYEGDQHVQTIVNSTENDGSYIWVIPADMAPSSYYRVKISSVDNPSYHDWSNSYFAVWSSTNNPLYVDRTASGLNDGSSWGNAFTELSSALAVAVKGQQIWVARGTYRPDYDVDFNGHSGDRTAGFEVKNGVEIYGGFPKGGSTWQQRDPNQYLTVLTGDLANDDPNTDDNSYHVVKISDTDETSIIDGFSITAGEANGVEDFSRGSGIYCTSADAIISNCTIMGNCAGFLGGGAYVAGGEPVFINCVFKNNSAVEGGGVHVYQSEAEFSRCRFIANSSQEAGGLFVSSDSNPDVLNCLFTANYAQHDGGGIFIFYPTNTVITNCTLAQNTAGRDGGGLLNYEGVVDVRSCIFNDNLAEDGDVNGVNGQIGGLSELNYCCLQGYSEPNAANDINGVGIVDVDPLFVRPGWWDGSSWIEGNYRLQSKVGRWDPNLAKWVIDSNSSPCLDKGDPAADYSGEPVPNGGRVNLGFYGGTAQASMSGESWQGADVNGDGVVDRRDLQVLINQWLMNATGEQGDLDGSGFVDFLDYSHFAGRWPRWKNEGFWP